MPQPERTPDTKGHHGTHGVRTLPPRHVSGLGCLPTRLETVETSIAHPQGAPWRPHPHQPLQLGAPEIRTVRTRSWMGPRPGCSAAAEITAAAPRCSDLGCRRRVHLPLLGRASPSRRGSELHSDCQVPNSPEASHPSSPRPRPAGKGVPEPPLNASPTLPSSLALESPGSPRTRGAQGRPPQLTPLPQARPAAGCRGGWDFAMGHRILGRRSIPSWAPAHQAPKGKLGFTVPKQPRSVHSSGSFQDAVPGCLSRRGTEAPLVPGPRTSGPRSQRCIQCGRTGGQDMWDPRGTRRALRLWCLPPQLQAPRRGGALLLPKRACAAAASFPSRRGDLTAETRHC